MRGLTAAAFVAIVVGGCMDPSPDIDDLGPSVAPAPDLPPGVVVADIGPGTNPYHQAFRRSGPEWEAHPCERVPASRATSPDSN